MKLTPVQIARTASRVDARPVPDGGELVHELTRVFGDHTFFLSMDGLHIVDPTESTPSGASAGRVVTVAKWTDSHRRTLAPQEPELTDVVIELEAA